MFIIRNTFFALIFCTILTGCNSKQDLTSENGEYFISSLGSNIAMQTHTQLDNNFNNEKDNIILIANYNLYNSRNKNIRINTTPLFTNNLLVILNDEGYISAYNQELKKQWRINFFDAVENKEKFCSNLTLQTNQHIIVGSCGTNVLAAFDINTGAKLWSQTLDTAIGSTPTIIDDKIIIFTKIGSVYAVKAISGDILWVVPSIRKYQYKTIFPTQPIIYKNSVLQYDEIIRSMDLESGVINWAYNGDNLSVKGKDFIQPNVILDINILYLNNLNGIVMPIKIGDIKPLWTKQMITSQSLLVHQERVFAVNDLGVIYSLNTSDGSTIWSNNINPMKHGFLNKKIPYNELSFTTPIIFHNKLIVISSANHLMILNSITGKLINSQKFQMDIFGQPVVYKDKIYIITGNGTKLIVLKYNV